MFERLLRALFTALALLAFAACGSDSGQDSSATSLEVVNDRLLNGIPVEPGAVPQVVAVKSLTSEGPGLCTGVVLDANHVLTAAHCILGASQIGVSSSAGDYPATGVTIHPGYFENTEVFAIFNDVAILEFESLPLPGLPLIVSQIIPDEAFMSTVYGFGLDNPGVLQGGVVDIAQVTVNHLIGAPFSGKEASPCNGDSGAPLIYTLTSEAGTVTGIVGLVSTGTTPDCSRDDVTFYTNLQNPAVLNFIAAEVPGVSLQ